MLELQMSLVLSVTMTYIHYRHAKGWHIHIISDDLIGFSNYIHMYMLGSELLDDTFNYIHLISLQCIP